MARTLIIKNADFSVNKVTTVNIEEEIPCTGITLNNNTLSITHIGDTSTLVATVSPADTTDVVIWGSSNTDVVTVAGGVVTAIGCGSATITATCGNFSASCAVTVTHVAAVVYSINRYFGKNASNNYLNGGDLNNYAIGYSINGTKRISSASDDDGRCPFVIPAGATQISITNASDFKPYGFWLSSIEGAPGWTALAFAYPTDTFGGKPSNYGNRTVNIPDRTSGDYAGMDAVGFVFQYNGTITQEAADAIVVTFS